MSLARTAFAGGTDMFTIILTVHSLIVIALIGIILVQRSEGGALGIGGGGGGGLMTGRGAASALTRLTMGLAAAFFMTSIALAMLSEKSETQQDVIQDLTGSQGPVEQPGAAGTTQKSILDTFGSDAADTASEPASQPAAPTPAPAPDQTDQGDNTAQPASEPEKTDSPDKKPDNEPEKQDNPQR